MTDQPLLLCPRTHTVVSDLQSVLRASEIVAPQPQFLQSTYAGTFRIPCGWPKTPR